MVSTAVFPLGRDTEANRKISSKVFSVLMRTISAAKSFPLTYSDELELRRVLVDLRHGQS